MLLAKSKQSSFARPLRYRWLETQLTAAQDAAVAATQTARSAEAKCGANASQVAQVPAQRLMHLEVKIKTNFCTSAFYVLMKATHLMSAHPIILHGFTHALAGRCT
jgi:hypothetical protein